MNRMGRGVLAWQVVVVLLSSAAVGRAEAPKAALERLRAQANAAQADGRLSESRDLWRAIWKLEPSQTAACNMGALSYRLDRHPDAVHWLSRCKEMMRKPETPRERTLYESRLFDLEQARLRVGELLVHAPAGASLTLDGVSTEAEIGRPIPLDPGRHLVRAELRGAQTQAEVDVPRGGTREVTLAFPITPPGIPAQSADKSIPGRSTSPPTQGPRIGVVVGGVVASAAFLGLGAGLHVFANGQEENGLAAASAAGPNGCFRLTSPKCAEATSSFDTKETAQVLGTTSLVIGGALAAATIVYVVFPREETRIKVSAGGFAVSHAW